MPLPPALLARLAQRGLLKNDRSRDDHRNTKQHSDVKSAPQPPEEEEEVCCTSTQYNMLLYLMSDTDVHFGTGLTK